MPAPAPADTPSWAPRRRFGFLDIFIVIVVAAMAITAWPMLMAGPGRTAVVMIGGKPEARLQLVGGQRELLVTGDLGPMRIVYGGEGVRVLAAPCPNQICVHQGWVKRAGARLICLPSHMVIALDGGSAQSQGMDGVTY
jgi:hypothetical protein